MSLEDRVRTAAEATAATVREIRPFTMPGELPAAAPGSGRRGGRRPGPVPGGRHGWLVPLAAAVAVIAVAAILVAVRDLPGLGQPAAPRPAAPGPAGHGVAGLPRYAVVLVSDPVTRPGGGTAGGDSLGIIDTRSGKQVAEVSHPANITFVGVTGAADDRTFVVTASYANPVPVPGSTTGATEQAQFWYLLRIDPGGSRPATLTRLSIPQQRSGALIDGLALSPGGQQLAVLEWSELPQQAGPGSPATLTLYSVATGQPARTWTGGLAAGSLPDYGTSSGLNQNYAGLTWLADGRTLAFTYYARGQAAAVRTLDTHRPGGDLVAASRRVFPLPGGQPGPCAEALLTPDGRTVLCGTQAPLVSPCELRMLQVSAYSAATGERERVLFRPAPRCTAAGFGALSWAGSASAVVVMVSTGASQPGRNVTPRVVIGLLAGGGLVPVATGGFPVIGPGAIAF